MKPIYTYAAVYTDGVIWQYRHTENGTVLFGYWPALANVSFLESGNIVAVWRIKFKGI